MNGIGTGAAVLVLGLSVLHARSREPGVQDNLLRPPKGKVWKLIWNDDLVE